VVWNALGIVRTGDAMSHGRERLAALRDTLRRAGAAGAGGLSEWYALRSMLDTAELAVTSALLREESRGAHYREDFPARDDGRWRRPIFTRTAGDLDVAASAGPA
jgi:succinate dehydrogenase/fumarate reductase flavoprotein subunit